jgi:hypothetical protein
MADKPHRSIAYLTSNMLSFKRGKLGPVVQRVMGSCVPVLWRLPLGAVVVVSMNLIFALAIVAVNVAVSHQQLRDRVAYFVQTHQITSENWPIDFTGNKLDRFSDCTGVSLNLVASVDRSAVEMLADAEIVGPSPVGEEACEVLVRLNSSTEPFYYFRYWHGYQILTKPALLVLSLRQMRVLTGVLYVVSLIVFFLVAVPRPGRMLTASFLSASFVLLTGAEDLDGVLVHNLALTTTFAGGIVMYWIALRGSLEKIFFGGLVVASCTGFIDENYVAPMGAMAMLMAMLSARAWSVDGKTSVVAKSFAVVLCAWACGYLGTMILRVGVSVLVRPDWTEGIRDFSGQLILRLVGDVPWVTSGFFAPILRNVKHVVLSPFLPGVALAAAALGLVRYAQGWRFERHRATIFYFLVAAIPFPWYMLFRNYASLHDWFMYRWAAFGLVCAIASVLFGLRPAKKP